MAIGFIGPGFSAIASVCSQHECRYLRRFHMYFTFYILYLAVCRTFLDMIYAPSVINVDIFSSTLRQPIATRFKASVTKLGAIF